MLDAIGVVVHPSRDVSTPLHALADWARAHGTRLVQVGAHDAEREVASPGDAGDVDVVLAIGGDGTVLAALRAAAPARRPVLGVACGSVGALAASVAGDLPAALDRIAAGNWRPRPLPVLEARASGGEHDPVPALNDLVVVRDGGGQVTADVSVDGVLYARFAGDGIVAATAQGSSAYTIAAGGPLLAPGAAAWALTPLPHHGGFVPPLVVGADSRVEVEIDPGYGGARAEVDGQPATLAPAFSLTLRPGFAELVSLGDEEPFLAALRRRGIVTDSPRVLARERSEGPPGS